MRPYNLTPIVNHSCILDKDPVLKEVYGKTSPCSRVQCPDCNRIKWYPLSTLRRMVLRQDFDGSCIPCKAKRRDYIAMPSSKHGRRIGSTGYVELRKKAVDPSLHALYDAMKMSGAFVMEHRLVMAAHLGRPLLTSENVHHKNGEKADNRLENLELWSTSQPYGQRVEDKIAWAKEILDLYKDFRP